MKQYIGIIRDHSGSMGSIAQQALVDYNSQVEVMQREARVRDIDTLVSVVECGIRPTSQKPGSQRFEFRRDAIDTPVERLKPLITYPTPGGTTPLFDSLNDLLDVLEAAPDAGDKDVAFLVMVITDGYENVNVWSGTALGKRIRKLQETDRWTFTFRVPFGRRGELSRLLGIPAENILEWEQSAQGFQRATQATMGATQAYFGARAMGATRSTNFYADAANIPASQVKRELMDITNEVRTFQVRDGGNEIRPFVEGKLRGAMRHGGAFYQLSKPEPKVQAYKQLLIRDKVSGKVYGGQNARAMLGLPLYGDVKLSPGDQGQYDVFIQSTSVNRKLIAGTEVVYWPNVRY